MVKTLGGTGEGVKVRMEKEQERQGRQEGQKMQERQDQAVGQRAEGKWQEQASY